MLFGFIYAGGSRRKVFTSEYLTKNFGEDYKKVTGHDIAKTGGYPDVINNYI